MFDLSEFMNKAKKEYLDIGICKLPYENSPAYNYMIREPFLDIWGKRLFGIEEYGEGPYEIDEMTLSPTDTVLDVGANIGLFSAYACSLGCEVYAIEPLERNVRFLRLLKELNPGFDLTICQCVLSDYNGIAKLYNTGNDMGGGTIDDEIKNNNQKRDPRPMVSTLTNSLKLDIFIENQGIGTVDFIKADIEGAEISLLKGGRETIAKHKPKLSLCSYHRVTDPDTLEQLIKEISKEYIVVKGEKKIYAY